MVFNGRKVVWTVNAKYKMRYYGFSEQRVRRVLAKPERTEEGIAPGTIASMRVHSHSRHRFEDWVMYQRTPKTIRIIAAWKYPGSSPKRGPLLIPDDIMHERSNR